MTRDPGVDLFSGDFAMCICKLASFKRFLLSWMLTFCFFFPKVLPNSKVFCLFCLLVFCSVALHSTTVLNSPIVKSKLFLVAPVGLTTLRLSQSRQAGKPHLGLGLRAFGSDDMPLPWYCTLPETVPLILRPDPRTYHPAIPVLQRRSSRDARAM